MKRERVRLCEKADARWNDKFSPPLIVKFGFTLQSSITGASSEIVQT
jgi:hypothetical protein